MPIFTYRATDGDGKTIDGRMDAQDTGAVAARLQELNFFPLRVSLEAEGEEDKGLVPRGIYRSRGRTVLHFTNQLAVLLEAGLPLDRGLEISGDVSDDPRFRAVVAKIHRSVQEGSSLAEALARHPRMFSDLYVSMVRAGEASGALDQIVKQLGEFMEEWQRVKDVILSALLYPLFLVAFAGAAVAVLLLFVVPRFAGIFADMGEVLPLPTRIMMSFSQSLRHYWWVFGGGLAAAAAAAAGFLRSHRGRRWWDSSVLTMPVMGDLVVKVQVSRFARVFGTLIRSGVPILKALEIVTGTLTNTIFSRSLTRVQRGLKEGQGVSEPLRRAGVFPPLFLHMVAVGEETGRLEEMLLAIARNYDRAVETAVKRLLALLEPVIIVLMGILIGAIILSILWAIFSVNQVAF
jgi:general secretion pathway protein F